MIVVNFDRLICSYRAETPKERGYMDYYEGIKDFERGRYLFYGCVPSGEWGAIWRIFDNRAGLDVGLLLCNYKKGGHKNLIQLKFDDALFYTAGYDYAGTYTEIGQLLELEGRGVNAVDIALDTDEDIFFPGYRYTGGGYIERRTDKDKTKGLSGYDFLLACINGKVRRESKYNRSTLHPLAEFSGKRNGVKSRWDTMYMGKRGSLCFARHYNKSREMEANGPKTWVIDRWQRAGWRGGEVWRFEISFNKLSQKANKNLFLSTLQDYGPINESIIHVKNKYAGSWFFSAMRDFFRFRTFARASSRVTSFVPAHAELSNNYGYVVAIKSVKNVKKQKDLIRHNNITTYFSKYINDIFSGPLACRLFSSAEQERARWFISSYQQLHAADLAQKGPRDKILGRYRRRKKRPQIDGVHIYNMHLTKLSSRMTIN